MQNDGPQTGRLGGVNVPKVLMCQSGRVERCLRKASIGEVGTIGLDRAKCVFQDQGADASGAFRPARSDGAGILFPVRHLERVWA